MSLSRTRSHGRSVSAGGGAIGHPRRRLRIATRNFRRGGRRPRQPLTPGLPLRPRVVPRHGQVQRDATYLAVVVVVVVGVCLVDDIGGRTTVPPPSAPAPTRGDDRALVSSVFSVQSRWISDRAVIVDLFSLNPCWLFGRSLFVSMCFVICSQMIFSRTFEAAARQLTGL